MTDHQADGRSDPLDHDLRALLDDDRRRDAAARRRRQGWLRQAAAGEGTLAGILLDLAERRQVLALATQAGRTLTGVVWTLGADFLGLRSPSGDGTLVATSAITSLRPEPGSSATVGDRLVTVEADLRTVLADLAVERPWVSLHTRDGVGLAGELRIVGADVLTLARGADGPSVHVPVAALSDLVLP